MLRTCPVPLQAARPPADHLVAHCGAPSVAVAGKLGLNVPRNTSPASASSLPDSTDDLVDVDAELVTSSPSLDGNASESMIGRSENGNSLNITPPMLVSAMKGSRAKRGIVTNLSVSWAPDVYDPPVTSDSHTVRPHHRSSRKSHYKYKPPKGSSSSSSSSRSSSGSKKDKKHSHHSGSKKDKKHSHHSSRAGDHSLV